MAGAAAAAVAARPQAVRRRLPELCFLSALFRERTDVLGHLHIRGVCARLFDHGGQRAGVIQQRAGAQQIVAEGLAVAVGHEERRLEGLHERLFLDVGIGIVDEGAGLDVAVGVDVQVVAACGDAATDIFAVIPEVHREEGLGLAERAYLTVHELALLGGGHEVGGRAAADGHVGEEPAELGAHLHHPVEVLLAADHLVILRGVAAGNAEGQLLSVQQLHGGLHAGEGTLAAAEVGARLKALNGDGGDEVAYAQHLVGKGLVDERAVGEGEEHTVVVALAERDDVLFAHQRLAAGVDEHADAELLGLHDDGIQRVKVHVELVAVLGCPAAGAMEVAGAGGVHQDGPGHVAVVLLHGGSAARRPEEVRVDDKVFK